MTLIPRLFRQTSPRRDENTSENNSLEFFFDQSVIVVLGAPGMGKTTVFRQAAQTESDALFVRVGELLAATNLDAYKNKILYLDGLDEQRSKSKGKGVMDALVSKIRQINPSKIRISCRTAEWHGNQDIASIGVLFPQGSVYQLALMPLSENELMQLLPDEASEHFIAGAKKRNLEALITNPGDFFLLYEFYKEDNDWPKTRSELMEGACRTLLREVNPEHSDALNDKVNDVVLWKSSEYLSAIMMLSGIGGLATSRLNTGRNFPSIHQLDADLFHLKVASTHSLFQPIENGRIEPRHRKIAEYMAAKYLARRVKEGLSLRRLMTLLTGFDGKTAPDLRGVYAWMVTLLAGSAEKILHHDPYGAIIYGDTYSWTPNTKRTALRLLKDLSIKDPWFRQQDYSVNELGGLASIEVSDDLIGLIATDDCRSHLMGVVFDAISASSDCNISVLEKPLIEFIKNDEKPDHFRASAINALKTVGSNYKSVLKMILEQVNSNSIIDCKQYLRGALLEHLYPSAIKPSEITTYLIKPTSGFIGYYHMFLCYHIFELTPKELLPELAKHAAITLDMIKINRRSRHKPKTIGHLY